MSTVCPAPTPTPTAAGARPHRWLLFLHQLPASPSNLRVRTWRRLQQIGALPLKQAVYVLPDTAATREDLEWLKTEIVGAGGQANVFAADAVDTWSNDELIEEFRRVRQTAYAELARAAEQVLKASARRRSTSSPRTLRQLQDRLAAIEQIDFFGSAGRDRVATLLRQIAASRERPPAKRTSVAGGLAATVRRRLWVTRPRPGVDRMASAWLIRRFIDGEATFGFVADRDAAPRDSVPFDMFGVELTHRVDLCTFEVLLLDFGLDDPALQRVAQVVHDLDLKDGRFGAVEAGTIGLLIDGLQRSTSDDHQLLSDGMTMFEALYRASAEATRPSRPRAVAKRTKPAAKRTRSRS